MAKRISILAVAAVLASVLLLFSPAVAAAADPVTAAFVSPSGAKSEPFSLEVAETLPKRMAGLMYRKEMPANSGMIFIFPGMEPRSFWMKDTYLSLDMIFLNDQLEVVALIENVPILNSQPRESKAAAQYVIELNAGTAAKTGIVVGSKLAPQRPLPKTAE